jgi:hypothetical protein
MAFSVNQIGTILYICVFVLFLQLSFLVMAAENVYA